MRGLCKVVFATETLALGINMPARTVVIEKLSKWNGETHADITPGEYTQLTGRAGRRGLDVEGHGVVLWQPGMNPREVAGLASTRTYPLRSSFRPSYNMAVNLVHQFGRERSRELLEQSFAQFQADKAVVGLARQLHKAEDALAGYVEAATCHLGDFMEYAGLRRRISDVEKGASKARRADRREEAIASLRRLKPGDVIQVPTGKFAGYAVVVDPGFSPEGPRPYVVTAERQARRLAMIDFPTPVEPVDQGEGAAQLQRPQPADAPRPGQRRCAPRPTTCAAATAGSPGPRPVGRRHAPRTRRDRRPAGRAAGPPVPRLPRPRGPRPVGRALVQARPRRRNAAAPGRAAYQHRGSAVRPGLRGADGAGATSTARRSPTAGRHLMRIYSDMDLVAAESLRQGLWDGLSASELAAVLSVLVFEARRPDDASSPRLPGGRVKEVIGEMVRLWGELDQLEQEHHLDFLRQPDLGFAWIAYRWAEGDDLDDVLGQSELAAGDFVRWMKQLLDLTGQVADAAGDSPLRETAREAVRLLRRGVVAYTSLAD